MINYKNNHDHRTDEDDLNIDPSELSYSLEIVQQPQRARMCGFGDKDRRNITPAPVLKLIAKTKEGRIVTGDALCRQAFMVNADLWLEDEVTERNLVLISSIASTKSPTRAFTYMSEPHASADHGDHGGELGYVTDPTPIQFVPPRTSVITFPYHNQNHGSWAQREYNSQQYPIKIEPDQQADRGGRRYDGNGRGPIDEYEFYHYGEPSDWENLSTPNLVGQTTVGGQSAPDLDGRTTHIWFAFNMLSIRTEGVFKLRTTTKILYQVFSDPIYVQSPKKFLGACDNNDLANHLNKYSIRIPSRKDEKPPKE
ncbi:hypothetical protein K457DRAFT_12620 [Linnemannia elongata AG-77]|uniref:Velvet domain-containing protein n=1 Tax=Linnemannia elongata AG-77 TaxID=1314771 RepID=A0A197KG28_9FUNG|nr:hypothetical protein K457DRAFT_12620 [Linnemannia elongata AG-77]